MKICSWDVGIKNLAFCFITEIDHKSKCFEIGNWNVINLINPNITCDYPGCLNKSKFIVCGKGFCNKHKKTTSLNPLNNSICSKCCKIAEYERSGSLFCKTHSKNGIFNKFKQPICMKCKRIAIYEKDGINYCKIHSNQVLRPVKISCLHHSPQSMCQTMYDKLNELDFHVDDIIIENQPAIKTPVIKTISIFLFSYFIFNKDKFGIKNIKFVSPANKLKVNNILTKETLSKCQTKTERYKKTKELGYQYTLNLISETDKEKLKSMQPKKDDLCDAFLQGYYYLFM